MVTIRKYSLKDFEGVHRVSLKASSHPDKSGDELKYHYCMYTDYYTTCQTDTSFVAVNDQDEVVGYLLCAKNNEKYINTMQKDCIPKLKDETLEKRAKQEISLYTNFPDYEAHLHIDIDPDYQHYGIGSKMMTALKADLKEKGIKSLMLGVAAKNVNAVKFYEKNGFTEIVGNEYVKIMGLMI